MRSQQNEPVLFEEQPVGATQGYEQSQFEMDKNNR